MLLLVVTGGMEKSNPKVTADFHFVSPRRNLLEAKVMVRIRSNSSPWE
jgi:hypothetical protein